MSIDKNFVLKALLQHNFLPNQREEREELPPLLSSESFTESAARKLANLSRRSGRDQPGYDAVEYKLTRFNLVPRICSIPHPKAYADLVLFIHDHWTYLEYITDNEASMLRPKEHDDGRINIMNYGDRVNEHRLNINRAFGKHFVVHTDISNFFPSIYSHSITWALAGFDTAKQNRSKRGLWYNKLDTVIQMTKRNETQGIAIGPATSNIISEIILARVDEKMKEDFAFTRFIDDYTAYCDTYDQSQNFINKLSDELAKYKLQLNASKTKVTALPHQFIDDWVLSLTSAMPKSASEDPSSRSGVYAVVNYLNIAVSLAERSPDGSVLKYAIKSIIGYMKAEIDKYNEPSNLFEDDFYQSFGDSAVKFLLDYTLNLALYHPTLLPLLESLLEAAYLFQIEFRYSDRILMLVREYARTRYSDAISWSLYYSIKYNVHIGDDIVQRIIDTRDCIPLLLVYLSGNIGHQNKVLDFVNNIDQSDLYEVDRYWILLYQLFLDGAIGNPYATESTFVIMKANSVDFVRQDLLELWRNRYIW